MKNYLATGLIGALLITNGVVGYQFKESMDEKNHEIKVLTEQNKKLDKIIVANNNTIKHKNELIEQQQNEINTYKTEIENKDNTINQQQSKIGELEKQVSEASNARSNLP